MEKFVINPENYSQQYIKNLNACFGHWGGDAEYDWGLERKIGNHSTDIMLIENEEDGVIAGSAVSYRELSGPKRSCEIGIMTGSWTLPAARRKGCFTKMIHCSRDLCKQNDVPFLTAFVTETNASSRRLETEGSFMFPTFHLFSPEIQFGSEGLPMLQLVEPNEELVRKIYERTIETQEDLLTFRYSLEEFQSQYLDRIKETTILKIGNDYAILENGQNEVKILLLTSGSQPEFKSLIKAVANWCLENRNRKTFFFTTRKELAKVCVDLEFENVPGYFTILASDEAEVDYEDYFKDLHINMADKM